MTRADAVALWWQGYSPNAIAKLLRCEVRQVEAVLFRRVPLSWAAVHLAKYTGPADDQ